MRIEAYNTTKINTQNISEKETYTISKNSVSDIIAFGSSNDILLNKDAKKTSFLAGEEGSITSVKEQAQVLKDSLSAVFNKMDTGRTVELNEEVSDINNTESEKIVTVVEQIQIKLAAYCKDFQATVDINADEIEKVMGDGVRALKIARSFAKSGICPTKENVSEAMEAVSMTEGISHVSDNMKAYMIQNELEPTINNMYIAAYSGYTGSGHAITDEQWSGISAQVEKILADAGISINEENINKGRWMIDNDIDVTKENFKRLTELDKSEDILHGDDILDKISKAMTEGIQAKNAWVTDRKYPWEKAVEAVKTLNNIKPEHIFAASETGRDFTLEMYADLQVEDSDKVFNFTDNQKYLKEYRTVVEAQLLMTVSAARVMEQNGISVNTTPLEELVDRLKEYELMTLKASFNDTESNEITMDTVDNINDVLYEIEKLKYVPAAVIGDVLEKNQEPTVVNLAVGTVPNKAGYAYEALSTQIRPDLGDSLFKAISASTEDVLSNLGYENNDENRRAVRILAYNDMEITPQNIDAVKNVDYSVNVLFNNLQPQKVLTMIRDGKNPLTTPVDELNDYINEMADTGNPAEKYSEFLYRMDKKKTITAEEREKFIGIYSLVNKFRKDGMRAAGQIVNQDLPLTMGNLLSAYMTRKDRNTEYVIDDETIMKLGKDKMTYYKNLFGSIKNQVTPEFMESVSDGLNNMSPEVFAQKAREYNPEENYSGERYYEIMKEASTMEDNVYKFVTDSSITPTYNNLLASKMLVTKTEDIFSGISDDEDTEKRIMDALTDKDSAVAEYENLFEHTKELINESVYTDMSYMDMESLRQLGNNMSLVMTLARKNNYYIPYTNGGEKGIINLKIMDSGEDKGRFTIDIRCKDKKTVHVTGMVTDSDIKAGVISDSEVNFEQIKTALESRGFDNVKITADAGEFSMYKIEESGMDVPSSRIFTVAKIFIEHLSN